MIYITPKNYPLLYTKEFQITKWLGDEEFQFYWEDKIKYKAFSEIDFHNLIENYRQFMQKNKHLMEKGLPLIYLDNPFYILKAFVKLLLKRGVGFDKKFK